MVPTPAQALWRQRYALSARQNRWKKLMAAVNRPVDFAPHQWFQIAAMVLDFRPDVIIELGRGVGNSTACFLEAICQSKTEKSCRLISACLSGAWETETAPRLRALCNEQWFEPGHIFQGDIRELDDADLVDKDKRYVLFWDAHGFELAHWVMSRLLPRFERTDHVVIMHDMIDAKFEVSKDYEDCPFWQGDNCIGFVHLDDICTGVGQGVAMVDFANRNHMPLHPARRSIVEELESDPAKVAELVRLFGNELVPIRGAHWAYFSLNEASAPVTYPNAQIPISELQKLRAAHDQLQWKFDQLVHERDRLKDERDALQFEVHSWHNSVTMRLRNHVMKIPVVSGCLRSIGNWTRRTARQPTGN